MTNDGKRFLDMIPKEAILQVNSQEMKIRLINGSLLQIIGSDNIDSIVGTNPICILFSEMALQDERAYQLLRPILAGNDGKCIMISTPRGKNFFHQTFLMAQNSSKWFVSYLTLDDTKHIPLSEIERDREEGLLSEALIRQEFWCDWNMGVQGSYYGKMLDQMRRTGQIGKVFYDPVHLTHVAIDIGWNDPTAVIFFQVINNAINIIDYVEADHEKIEWFADVIKNRGYRLGTLIGPHDLRKTSQETGNTTWMVYNQLGLTFKIAPDCKDVNEDITKAQSILERCCIDETKCARLIKCLENYRASYNPKTEAYSDTPMHTWASHGSDAFRYLAVSLSLIEQKDVSKEELEASKMRALYGTQTNIPKPLQDPPRGGNGWRW